jgi:hypothetical protein
MRATEMPFDPEKFNEFKKSGFDPDRFSAFKATQQKPVEMKPEPMYDPASGAAIGYTETPVAAPTMPYGEQMRNVGQFAADVGKGVALGVPSGAVGLPGDIESLARFGLSKLGADVDTESFLPTSERAYGGIRGVFTDEPMTPAEKAGSFVGEFLGPSALSKGLGIGLRGLVGGTTETTAKYAKKAEDLGFKLEPGQLREAEAVVSPGFAGNAAKNQKLANQLVSKETGVKADRIDADFIGERLKELGKNYNKIFSGSIKVDRQLVNELQRMADFEASVKPANVGPIRDAANNIIARFNAAAQQIPGTTRISVPGKDLQTLREELTALSATESLGSARKRAGEFVGYIDDAIGRFDKSKFDLLKSTNKKMQATKTLEDAVASGNILQGNVGLNQLGRFVDKHSFGYGSGTSTNPLADIAKMGEEVNLGSMRQGVVGAAQTSGAEALKSVLGGKVYKYFGTPLGLRTQAARRAQRGEDVVSPKKTLPAGAASVLAPQDEQTELPPLTIYRR